LLQDVPQRPHDCGSVLVAINQGFSPRKNVSTLIEAMPLVRRVFPTATLRLIGGDYGPGESASQYAARRGLGDGIQFLGRLGRAQVLAELTAATAFVHPSKEESFGLVIAEAMARRTPVIAGRGAGAVPWILEGGKSGALCNVESAKELAETIIEVIGSPELRARYAENGFKRVNASFMMDQMITSFEQLYLRITSAKG
jgi:L-malate glycosyltransferase